MSQTLKATPAKVSLATAVIVYGLDEHAKPQAARFPERLCDLAIKAAQQLKLNVLKVTSEEIAQIAGRLPIGRINASGRGLVPFVKQPMYDQIVEVARTGAMPTSANSSPVPLNEARKDGNPVGTDGLPNHWKDIGPNHLVLVQETLSDGWWECIVVARKDDMLTVRWRDYTKWPAFTVHADAVALLNAAPSFKV